MFWECRFLGFSPETDSTDEAAFVNIQTHTHMRISFLLITSLLIKQEHRNMDITYEHIRREFQALSQTYEIRICILERSLADSDTFTTEKHPLMLQMQMILRPHFEKN